MNKALDGNLFDFINYSTAKCPTIAKPNTEQVIPQLLSEKQDEQAPLQLSIQEPYYPVFALEPCLVFLVVFVPLFLSVVMNADAIISIFVTLVGKLMGAQ